MYRLNDCSYMKKYYLLLITIIVSLILEGCQNQQETDFMVTGNIENVEDDYIILFFKSNPDGSATTIAVDTLVNGRFEFTAPAETGVQYHIMSPHIGVFPSTNVDFYVEPGANIKITGKNYLTKNWTVKTDVKDQKIYQSYFDEVADCLISGEYIKLRELSSLLMTALLSLFLS